MPTIPLWAERSDRGQRHLVTPNHGLVSMSVALHAANLAKRLECAQLAAAFKSQGHPPGSASRLARAFPPRSHSVTLNHTYRSHLLTLTNTY
ncbi:hypothetical protein SBV1_2210040 [Verrucomicrobia bacterium]|nr:hypothetical protein SBV1_2210040 [Verrucomicrobiota bacterium]